jgi:hypothetical protein
MGAASLGCGRWKSRQRIVSSQNPKAHSPPRFLPPGLAPKNAGPFPRPSGGPPRATRRIAFAPVVAAPIGARRGRHAGPVAGGRHALSRAPIRRRPAPSRRGSECRAGTIGALKVIGNRRQAILDTRTPARLTSKDLDLGPVATKWFDVTVTLTGAQMGSLRCSLPVCGSSHGADLQKRSLLHWSKRCRIDWRRESCYRAKGLTAPSLCVANQLARRSNRPGATA